MTRFIQLYFSLLIAFKRTCLLIFGGSLVIAASMMLVGSALIWSHTRTWPTTNGNVTKFNFHPIPGRRTRVQLDLSYQYTVGGRPLRGTSLSPVITNRETSQRFARRKQRKYSANQRVVVYYDPKDPGRSFLELPDVFWDVSVYPASIGCLGLWMLYLFVQTRRRRVPADVKSRADGRLDDMQRWKPILEAVVDREHCVLLGTTRFAEIGGLLAGWPNCRVALVASPSHFALIPGPYTQRGVASTLLTLLLEFSLSWFWLPLGHGLLFFIEMLVRKANWRVLEQNRIDDLIANRANVKSVSIDEAIIYGIDDMKSRFWFRLPGSNTDEFIQIASDDIARANELLAFCELMQQSHTQFETTLTRATGR